jgi:hypothetical protein
MSHIQDLAELCFGEDTSRQEILDLVRGKDEAALIISMAPITDVYFGMPPEILRAREFEKTHFMGESSWPANAQSYRWNITLDPEHKDVIPDTETEIKFHSEQEMTRLMHYLGVDKAEELVGKKVAGYWFATKLLAVSMPDRYKE